MRIERFIPFWAEELNSFTTPFEAGNGYNVKLDKVNIIEKKNHATIKNEQQQIDTAKNKQRCLYCNINNIYLLHNFTHVSQYPNKVNPVI